MDNIAFMTESIEKLLQSESIIQTIDEPHVINPLTVDKSRSGKLRLVLDCRIINKHIAKYDFRYEDANVGLNMIESKDFMCTFDLKSAYNHLTMYDCHTEYLGFKWNNQYYKFRVLLFGISTASYIFAKITKVLVKHWRSQGLIESHNVPRRRDMFL